jgi:hypothetical protein
MKESSSEFKYLLLCFFCVTLTLIGLGEYDDNLVSEMKFVKL